MPQYLLAIKTCYTLDYKRNHPRLRVQVIGSEICVNPAKETIRQVELEEDQEYSCMFGETLVIRIDRENMQTDLDHVDFWLVKFIQKAHWNVNGSTYEPEINMVKVVYSVLI